MINQHAVSSLDREIKEQIKRVGSAQDLYDYPPRGCSDVRLFRECQLLAVRRLQAELRVLCARKVKLLNMGRRQMVFDL